jgi:predicted DNA-binding transcriptional regulator YafY
MRRADRLFDIIRILRAARRPVTAAALAAQLEVTVRTVYRDIVTLQARRVPIEGAAGLGYVLRPGFDLPPLMFTADELDAVALGVRLVRRTRDADLQAAAERVLSKVLGVLPEALRPQVDAPALYISDGNNPPPEGVDLAAARGAIRATRKMRIAYVDGNGTRTERTIWPIAMAYYVDVTLIGAWCELRRDFRNFRVDRISEAKVLDERFPADNGRLFAEWLALRKERPDLPTRAARAARTA